MKIKRVICCFLFCLLILTTSSIDFTSMSDSYTWNKGYYAGIH